MSAYEGEFIYLFKHYFSSDSIISENSMTVQKPKNVTVNLNIPFDIQGVVSSTFKSI